MGDVLWKRSNRLDPASNTDKVRFFVQDQLGAIIGIIAFVPLIILILLNTSKDNTIYSGTVAEAHAAGKQRLTLEVDQELAECGFPPRSSASEEATAPAVLATPTP